MGKSAAVKMPKRPKSEQGKIELRADQAWIERVEQEAARLHLNRSAYIRLVVTQAMDRAADERREKGREAGGR